MPHKINPTIISVITNKGNMISRTPIIEIGEGHHLSEWTKSNILEEEETPLLKGKIEILVNL